MASFRHAADRHARVEERNLQAGFIHRSSSSLGIVFPVFGDFHLNYRSDFISFFSIFFFPFINGGEGEGAEWLEIFSCLQGVAGNSPHHLQVAFHPDYTGAAAAQD